MPRSPIRFNPYQWRVADFSVVLFRPRGRSHDRGQINAPKRYWRFNRLYDTYTMPDRSNINGLRENTTAILVLVGAVYLEVLFRLGH